MLYVHIKSLFFCQLSTMSLRCCHFNSTNTSNSTITFSIYILNNSITIQFFKCVLKMFVLVCSEVTKMIKSENTNSWEHSAELKVRRHISRKIRMYAHILLHIPADDKINEERPQQRHYALFITWYISHNRIIDTIRILQTLWHGLYLNTVFNGFSWNRMYIYSNVL